MRFWFEVVLSVWAAILITAAVTYTLSYIVN